MLDPAKWTRRARSGSTWIDDLVHPGRTLDLFADGSTIVLQSLHRWWPPLAEFCRSLEVELGHAVQANAYLTPPGAAGLSAHHDTHDVFVLQVHGSKHWTLREPLVDAPLARHRSNHEAAAEQPVLEEVDLGPGDCLYLPRGFIHSAAAQEGTSLHLTIGVLATTVHDLVQRIVDRAGDDPAFRRSLPPGYGEDGATAAHVVKGVVADLVSWLERLDVDEVAADVVDHVARRRVPLMGGHLLDLASLDEISDETTVIRRHGAVARVEPAGDRVLVVLVDRRVDLPASVDSACDSCWTGRAIRSEIWPEPSTPRAGSSSSVD